MCDCKTNIPIPEQMPMETGNNESKPYRYSSRNALREYAEALRNRANAVDALLRSIPEEISEEAENSLHLICNALWNSKY